MVKYKECEICGFVFSYTTGKFTIHLQEEHNISLKDYIIKYDYSGQTPKCQCGYCDDDAPFFRGRFLNRIGDHQKYKWLQEEYIKKYGVPKCKKCGNDVKWNRSVPNTYCSSKCHPSQWNQEKIKKTIKEKYGVNCVSSLKHVKAKLSNSQIQNYKYHKSEIVGKFKATCLERYGFDDPFKSPEMIIKTKKTMIERYGVDHPSKTLEYRNNSSLRMIKNNSTFDFKECYKVKKYKETGLCYQSSYEYHFLDYCENNNILDIVENGNTYILLNNNFNNILRMIIDFCIDDVEIEIKSTYILDKQGGINVIENKRKSVEITGKKYLLILDKNYTEFNEYFIKNE